MKLHSLIALSCLATAVYAAPETFDFKDPKGVNNAVFKLTAPLETIEGSASGISGTVSFDPENPAATTGKIVVAGESLTVPIKLTYLADKLSAEMPNLKGDLLVIRANFVINREDFNIQKGQFEDKVANTIDLSLSIAGAAIIK